MSVDELGEYGMERMDADEIGQFLATQKTGVLGLPSENGPYMLPLTYGYDGDSRLFFTFVLGASSRKETLSDRAENATFLVFQVDSMFVWESVLLSGSIETLPESQRDVALEALTGAWRPDVYEQAELTGGARIYAFGIEDWSGIKHTSTPTGFEP
jgi:nitroimidazol reductase NimA-like FMN-containing flavoprotein (pyridoxamine 5'-phosphate oxidase superfamily)